MLVTTVTFCLESSNRYRAGPVQIGRHIINYHPQVSTSNCSLIIVNPTFEISRCRHLVYMHTYTQVYVYILVYIRIQDANYCVYIGISFTSLAYHLHIYIFQIRNSVLRMFPISLFDISQFCHACIYFLHVEPVLVYSLPENLHLRYSKLIHSWWMVIDDGPTLCTQRAYVLICSCLHVHIHIRTCIYMNIYMYMYV